MLNKSFKGKIKNNFYFLYPFFVSIFPILSFYNYNKQELSVRIITTPLLLSLAFAGVLLFALHLILRNRAKASVITTFLILVFFSWGHVNKFLFDRLSLDSTTFFKIEPPKFLALLVLAGTIFGVVKVAKSKRNFFSINQILGLAFFFLVALLVIQITIYEARTGQNGGEMGTQSDEGSAATPEDTVEKPDIYYLILDAYAREDFLNDLYSYDNSEFINFLESEGFYVASKSNSNYAHTFFSLASSLNLDYVNSLSETLGVESKDVSLPSQMIEANKVVFFLKPRGYKIINFPSGVDATHQNSYADIDFREGSLFTLFGKEIDLDEFYLVFLQTTMLSPFIQDRLADEVRTRILYTFDKLGEIPYIRGPKFVMAHIIIPHPPYLFDENGKPVPNAKLNLVGEFEDRENYLNQLIFATKKIKVTIEKIIERSSQSPIIILQSDHGPASILGHPHFWARPHNQEGIKERMGILNAIRLPGYSSGQLYSSITPVNTFRLIFNEYFGQNYELLEDKSYFSDYKNLYEFFDVTDLVNTQD